VKLVIVHAPGLLYPVEESPPVADPISSGLAYVRAVLKGYGVTALYTATIPGYEDEGQALLKEWCRAYDLAPTWALTTDSFDAHHWWSTQVLTFISQLRATPAMVLTGDPLVAEAAAAHGIPVSVFIPPNKLMPDWGPLSSTWADRGAVAMEE
jgi:hypothetical protein